MRDLQSLRQRLKYYQTRCNTPAARVKERDAHIVALSTQTNFRLGRNVSVFGGHNLALARNRGHLGSRLTAPLVAGGEHQGQLTAESKSRLSIVQQPRNKCEPVPSTELCGHVQTDSCTRCIIFVATGPNKT